MAGINNQMMWEREKVSNHENAKRAVVVAHKQEDAKKRKGWQYVNITKRTKVLVPCNKKGKPTLEGERMIERFKQQLHIV